MNATVNFLFFLEKLKNNLSTFFSFEKLISIIPISEGFDLTTLPPTTSPNN